MDDPVRIAAVRDHPSKPIGDAEAPLRVGQQHYAAVGCDPSSIEGSADLLARYRWQVEWQRDILAHGRFVSPQSLCRFGRRNPAAD